MSAPNWKKLTKLIPPWVKVGPGKEYEIIWVDRFKDGEHVGETRFTSSQIAIQKGHTSFKTIEIYLHELLHAISDEHNVGLTETQILQLEKAFRYLLAKNNVFKSKD